MLSRFAVCLLVAAVLCSRNPTLRANSSNSLMDVSPDGTRLLVANPDNGTVTVVDTAARKAVRRHGIPDDLDSYCSFGKLLGWPALVLVAGTSPSTLPVRSALAPSQDLYFGTGR